MKQQEQSRQGQDQNSQRQETSSTSGREQQAGRSEEQSTGRESSSTDRSQGREELSSQDLQNTSGGFLGSDDSRLTSITQGYVNQEHRDSDGDNESNSLNFGTGNMTDLMND